MKRCFTLLPLAAMLTLSLVNIAAADDWATLKVKFVYDGKAPQLDPLDGSKDPFCANLTIADERMIVGKDGALVNIALVMDPKKSEVDAIHPDLINPPKEPVVIDNNGCVFKPRVLFVQAGRTLKVTNTDKCGHNAKIDPFDNANPAINDIVPMAGEIEVVFGASERSNFTPIGCTIHPWMVGQLIIRDHPYVGISGEDGVVTIKDLPAGKVTFKIVHENMKKAIDEGTVNGKKEKWSRGYMEVELKPGMNDLGTITLDPELFED